jgi:hypothetical protein
MLVFQDLVPYCKNLSIIAKKGMRHQIGGQSEVQQGTILRKTLI